MPQLGESIAEATVVNLLVQVGDQVKADQDVVEVETNKATMNVTSPCPGQVHEWLVKLNESYPVGDVLGYLEVNQEDAERLEEKLRSNEFTLEDFRDQLKMIRKMGPLESIMGMLPGLGNIKALADNKPDDKQMSRVEAIINSMTPDERRKQHIINGSRRKRIARGSGTTVEEVNRLLKQFVQMQKMLKQFGGMAGLSGGGKKARRQAMQIVRSRH